MSPLRTSVQNLLIWGVGPSASRSLAASWEEATGGWSREAVRQLTRGDDLTVRPQSASRSDQ